jgi:hypothetical protein
MNAAFELGSQREVTLDAILAKNIAVEPHSFNAALRP